MLRKISTSFYLSCIVFLSTLPGCIEKQELLKPGKVVIAYDQLTPPYEWNDAGTPKGFDIDILTEIFKRMGLEAEFIPHDWVGVQEAVKSGKADAIAAMGITEERKEIYDFSDSYMFIEGMVFVESEVALVTTLADLHGKTVAIPEKDFEIQFHKNSAPRNQPAGGQQQSRCFRGNS